MPSISAFFMRNIVFVYFFYGLAFFAMGLVVILESTRASEFRFARALRPLAAFGILHAVHEWYEMAQIIVAHETGRAAGMPEEIVRTVILVASFVCLLTFGVRLVINPDGPLRKTLQPVAALTVLYAAGIWLVWLRFRPQPAELLPAADVLARYSLGIPSAVLACIALLRERRDFHARGMSEYGRDLLWAALAFFIYGVVGQVFTRPSLLFPSQTVNTALFLRMFGVPVHLLRGLAAVAIAVTLGRALRAFELEGRLRLARANKARLEAQMAALESQERRVQETQALNIQLAAGARELSALVQMSRMLVSTVDLDRVLGDGLYQIVHSFSSACCSVLFLRRPDGGLELAGKYRRPLAPYPELLPPLTQAITETVKHETAAGAGLDCTVRLLDAEALADDARYRTLAVPLRAKGELLGGVALSSLREDEPFGQPELSLLIAFGQQLAAAVDNARLYRELQQREVRLEELLRQLVNAQETERRRIARELHDDTGQKLSALAMGLAAVESFMGTNQAYAGKLVRDLRQLTDDGIFELRNIMTNLRPSQLDDLGLVPALRWLVQQYTERYPEIAFQLIAERPAGRLPEQHETVLFRVAQEALNNAARHAEAKHVEVELCWEPARVRLVVSDDGSGFDPSAPARRSSGGFGLVGIRERVALVSGKLEIQSHPGAGTIIHVELPVAETG